MNFKIIKQKFGTSVQTTIFETETETEIKVNDFCFVEEKGFIIAMDDGIVLLTPENELIFSWAAHVNNPKAICFKDESKMFYVVDGYKNIKRFSLYNPYAFEVMGEKNKGIFNKYLSKIKDDCVVDCSADSAGQVYFVNNKLNRCLKVDETDVKNIIGNGRSGFSISTELKQCQINKPTGVCYYEGDIYISDTNNNCIRKITRDNKVQTVLGTPELHGEGDLLNTPSKMVIKKGLIYFIDDNKIRYSAIDNLDMGVIYKSKDRIISLDVDDNKFLYVLSKKREKENAN